MLLTILSRVVYATIGLTWARQIWYPNKAGGNYLDLSQFHTIADSDNNLLYSVDGNTLKFCRNILALLRTCSINRGIPLPLDVVESCPPEAGKGFLRLLLYAATMFVGGVRFIDRSLNSTVLRVKARQAAPLQNPFIEQYITKR